MLRNQAFVADFHPQRVEEHQRIARLQRTVLPFADRLQNRVGHRRDQIGRNIEPIDLKQVALNFSNRHPARVHRHDLLVEAWKPALVSGDQLGIKRALAVARDTDIELRRLGDHALARIAVPVVLLALRRIAIKVIVDLSVQNTLGQRLLQCVEKPILVENLLRIAAVQKLIQSVFLDCHNRPPSASLWPRTQDSRQSPTRQPADQRYESAYLFGAICPARGVGAALALPHANTEAMQLHLDEISATVAVGAHAVLIFDRAGWHTTPNLLVPDNITPIWLPSRPPELNPVENIWQYLRANRLSNRVFETFDAICDAICDAWSKLIAQPETITSIGMRDCAHVGQSK